MYDQMATATADLAGDPDNNASPSFGMLVSTDMRVTHLPGSIADTNGVLSPFMIGHCL